MIILFWAVLLLQLHGWRKEISEVKNDVDKSREDSFSVRILLEKKGPTASTTPTLHLPYRHPGLSLHSSLSVFDVRYVQAS
jgi:hypothetical protein